MNGFMATKKDNITKRNETSLAKGMPVDVYHVGLAVHNNMMFSCSPARK